MSKLLIALQAIAAFPNMEPTEAYLKARGKWDIADTVLPPYLHMARVAEIAIKEEEQDAIEKAENI